MDLLYDSIERWNSLGENILVGGRLALAKASKQGIKIARLVAALRTI
jgi:hypothetical protein